MKKAQYPLISVVVPVYNAEKYIDQCVESIVNQTYTNLEIILVDDGATDLSGERCEKWVQKDRRIKAIHKENGGLVSARKAGVLAASGEYIGYVDSDDWIELDMYKLMYEQVVEHNADIVAVENFREYSDGSRDQELIMLEKSLYQGKSGMEKLVANLVKTDDFFQYNVPMHIWRHLFRRDVLIHNQLKVDDRVGILEDVACVFPCYMEAKIVAILHKKLYHYRQHESSMKHIVRKRDINGCGCVARGLWQAFLEYSGDKDRVKKEIIFVLYYALLWSAYEYCILENENQMFPYAVPRNAKIALYGAGPFGKQIYDCVKYKSIVEVVLWVDKRWKIYAEQNLNVQSVEELKGKKYDFVVIAVLSVSAQNEIKEELSHMGIPEEKIRCCNADLFSETHLKRLLENMEKMMG